MRERLRRKAGDGEKWIGDTGFILSHRSLAIWTRNGEADEGSKRAGPISHLIPRGSNGDHETWKRGRALC